MAVATGENPAREYKRATESPVPAIGVRRTTKGADAVHAADMGSAGGPIAEIAEARLSDAAKGQIAMLLAIDESHAQHLDQIASWADAVRPSRPEAGPWHFGNTAADGADASPTTAATRAKK